MKAKFYSFWIGLLLLSGTQLTAQDIHFSQYGSSPLQLSPGLAGVYGCDVRFNGNYRNQWKQVEVPYNTVAASVENKWYTKKCRYDKYFTGGLQLAYDRQGDLALSSLNVGLTGSYTAPVGKMGFLTGGASALYGQRNFDNSKITTDAQWTGKYFDSNLPLGDVLGQKAASFVDFSAGVNYRWNNAATRSKVDFGVGVHHIGKPKQSFWQNDDVRLNRRYSFYAMGGFPIGTKMDIIPQASFQMQGSYREFVPDVMARFYLKPNVYQPVAFGLGIAARTGYRDAIIPHAELLWGTWQFGFSYDINTSAFKTATTGRGGPEFSAIYRFCKVRPIPMYKICPII